MRLSPECCGHREVKSRSLGQDLYRPACFCLSKPLPFSL